MSLTDPSGNCLFCIPLAFHAIRIVAQITQQTVKKAVKKQIKQQVKKEIKQRIKDNSKDKKKRQGRHPCPANRRPEVDHHPTRPQPDR
ncbi:hypothetical protein Misp01_74130 [Microtetraspora sp. NBRC 13810]|uniref:hypothetical protein n=1 Tax=Microtetraspora sp. NBRC 13810 TaxID=3030990 RepID=UPI0024A358BE|nr:hypothetical protein [Microtetraspora sp. NBRC 13810]GLW12285.1 hypothetical protein Misp01_74130 [Microtetraspora sp. NBRC 13810]